MYDHVVDDVVECDNLPGKRHKRTGVHGRRNTGYFIESRMPDIIVALSNSSSRSFPETCTLI